MAQDYDNFAFYYDLKYSQIDLDLGFYHEMARRAGANPKILELACGTGRVALPLLEAGFKVTGLDISEKMLDIARAKVEETGEPSIIMSSKFVQGDMRHFDLKEQFDLIFIALNSFQHMLTQADQLACLQVARQHLAPVGRFIVCVYNPEEKESYPADGRVEFEQQLENPENGNSVQIFLSTVAEPTEQIRRYTYFFDEVSPDGSLKRTTAKLSLRYSYRFELQLLLEKAGFSIEDFYGSYEFDEYGPGSDKLIYVCRRG